MLRGELVGIAITARHQRRAAKLFLARHRCRQEIVGLVASPLGRGKTARLNEIGKDLELIDKFILEAAPRLIAVERLVAISGCIEAIPADQDRPRRFGAIEPQQEVGKAKDGTGAFVAASADRFRQGVVGPVCKRVTIHNEERSPHASPLTTASMPLATTRMPPNKRRSAKVAAGLLTRTLFGSIIAFPIRRAPKPTPITRHRPEPTRLAGSGSPISVAGAFRFRG